MTKLIILDAGHGGSDPGSIGNGLKEKTITLAVVNKIVAYLKSHYGVECQLTRTGDDTLQLSERTRKANAWNADCLVSVHVNSATSSAATGFESFVYLTDGPTSKAHALQEKLHKKLADLFAEHKLPDRGKKQENLHMVREFKGPAVLVELGFISNKIDAALLKQDAFLNACAHAIGDGLAEYFNFTKQTPAENKAPQGLYRVQIDGKQIGAYGEPTNVLEQVKTAIAEGKKEIAISLI